jgi:hypothetical protein
VEPWADDETLCFKRRKTESSGKFIQVLTLDACFILVKFPRLIAKIVDFNTHVQQSSQLKLLCSIETLCGPFLGMEMRKNLRRAANNGSKRFNECCAEFFARRALYSGRGTHKVLN